MSQQGAYEPMPAGRAAEPVAAGEPPSTIRTATIAMYARAALGVLSIVLVFALKGQIRDRVLARNGANGAKALTPSQVDSAVTIGIAIAVIVGIAFLVLYLVLAGQLRKGRKWAWITTIVLAALGVLGLLGSFAQAGTALTHVVAVVAGLLDLLVLVLLVLPASRAYFARRTA